MELIKSELIFPADVDKTLIFDCSSSHPDAIKADYYGTVKYVRPHKEHIALLKSQFKRGYTVFVWSANGYPWVEEIVGLLKLNEYVHYGMTKPIKHLDDKDCVEWMGNRIYLPENSGD